MFRFRQPDVHQEEDELPWGRIALGFIMTIVIGGVLTAWAVIAVFRAESEWRPSHVFPEAHLGPRREIGMIHEELFGGVRIGQELNKAQRAELDWYKVVDRDKGIVSIPIDVAIRLVVEESKR